MRNLYLFVVYLVHCFSCSDVEIFTKLGFSDFNRNALDPELLIGGVKYKTFNATNQMFCLDNCLTNVDISYPSGWDYPKIFFLNDAKSTFRFLNNENINEKIEIRKFISDNINKITLDKGFAVLFAISWVDVNNEVLLAWNKEKTYLIITLNNGSKISENYTVSLGRGAGDIIFKNDLIRTRRTWYEISSHRMIRAGCTDIKDLIDKSPLKFSMHPNYLSNFGGELVTFQGHCFLEKTSFDGVIEIFNKQNQLSLATTSISVINIKENALQFKMPLVWHSGVYGFRYTVDGFVFESEAEIYSLTDSNKPFSVKWEESNQMNIPNYQPPNIKLTVDGKYDSAQFNVLDLLEVETNKVPQLKTYNLTSWSSSNQIQINLDELKKVSFDFKRNIGVFSVKLSSNETIWSAPLSLIWLQAKENYDKVCEDFLFQKKTQLVSNCPDHVNKTRLMLSTFQRVTLSEVDLNFVEIAKYDCYAQIAVSQSNEKNVSNGRTCCYNLQGGLIYGQDYYLQNNSRFGSYGWKYSPINNVFQHFLYDRLPIMSCCSLSSNVALCSKYWESYNVLHSSNDGVDYAGNIIGDPHVMPFNTRFSYSFLSRGEYWLMKGPNNTFGLQGRFYSQNSDESTLKGIAFSFNSNKVMISTKRNIVTKLDWSVLFNDKIVYLPFNYEGISIAQTADTQNLSIYIQISGIYFLHMELTRLKYVEDIDEYLNLNVHASNNFHEIVNGGLFGRVEDGANDSSLYNANTSEKLRPGAEDEEYFIFSKSWQIKSEIESLFSYVTKLKEFSNINAFEIFAKFNNASMSGCDDVRFCNIDKHLYGQGDFAQITKGAYNKRLLLNKENAAAKFGKMSMCDHPQLKFIKLDSNQYLEGSVIKVLGCIDTTIVLTNKDQLIRCQNFSLGWVMDPLVKDDLCKFTIKPSPVVDPKANNTILYIVVPLVFVLLILAVAASIILYKRRKMQRPPVNRSENSVTSQDALQNSTSIPMDDVYDTWQPNKTEQEEYGVYSQIKKPAGGKP